ncbi:MAG: MauE/DoxX family redox-associated membrane protein [Sandaracinaceae bacterium]
MTKLRAVLRVLLGVLMIVAGANHFISERFYVQIMPPYLPFPRELVWISGVSEIALGALLLVPRTRRLAGWGLIALLVAVFPANLHMALHEVQIDGEPAGPAWAMWARLPLQLVLIAWAFWVSRPDPDPAA